MKGFPCQSQFIMTWRADCFFKYTDTNTRLQGSWRIRETWYHQRNKIPTLDKWRSTNYLTKFKILLKKLSEPQENIGRQLHKIMEIIHEKNEKINKEIENIQKNQRWVMDLNNKVNWKMQWRASTAGSIKQKKEPASLKTSDLKLPCQEEKKKTKKEWRKPTRFMGHHQRANIHIIGVPEGEHSKWQKAYLRK